MQEQINADLWRANRKRKRAAWSLIWLGLLAFFVFFAALPHGFLKGILGVVIVGSLFGSRLLWDWANQEARFLEKDQLKDPPSLWK